MLGTGSGVDAVRCPASGPTRPGAGAGWPLHARGAGAPASDLYAPAPLGIGAGRVVL